MWEWGVKERRLRAVWLWVTGKERRFLGLTTSVKVGQGHSGRGQMVGC